MIGKKVEKYSGKPFKSGNKINTVKSVTEHPYREGKSAYTFEEDDSFVSVEQCKMIDSEKHEA